MSDKTGVRLTSEVGPAPPRPYYPPELVVYGTIRQATENVSTAGTISDLAFGGAAKTH